MKQFGRGPQLVTVDLPFHKDPAAVINPLVPFIYTQIPLVNYNTDKPDIRAHIHNAVLQAGSQEHKMF